MTIDNTGRPGDGGDVVDKGLASGSVGLLGGTVLGISCVAPAYTLTATIGLVAGVAGVKMPIIFIAGFIPMFLCCLCLSRVQQGRSGLRDLIHLDPGAVRAGLLPARCAAAVRDHGFRKGGWAGR